MQSVSLCAFRRNIRTRARLSHYIWLFLGKIVQIYTRVLIILNTIVYAKGQPVCIQTKHQATCQTFPLHLVIFRKNSTNTVYTHVLIILNTTFYAKGQHVCIQTKHQDTSQTFPLHLFIFRKNSTNTVYTHVLIILNTTFYAKGQHVCIQTKHQDTSQTFPLHLVIFRKNSTNIYTCTNNIKHDSLCKGSASVHSDETSGHKPGFPITFSYFQEKQYKYIQMY